MKNLNRLTVFAAGLLFAGIPGGYAKDINFGWPSGEGWSSQPYKASMEKGFFDKAITWLQQTVAP